MKQSGGLALLALGGGAIALMLGGNYSQSDGSATAPSGSSGRWPVVPAVNTGNIAARTFDEQHYAALITALTAHNSPAAILPLLARAMLAHQISETGRTAEWNYNVANSHPSANWNGSVFVLPGTRPNVVYQRAYDSITSGENDYVNSITQGAYALPLGDLAEGNIDEATWYSRVRAAGWTAQPPTGDELATYNTILNNLYAEFPG